MSTKLHNAFIADAMVVRSALGEMNISSFTVDVRISGRTLSDADECLVTYEVSAGYDHSVKGDSIEACLNELRRRLGWHKVHMPKALAAPRTRERAKAIRDEWNAEADIEPND